VASNPAADSITMIPLAVLVMMSSLERNIFASFRVSSQRFLLLCTPLLTGCKESDALDIRSTSISGRERLIVSNELRERRIEQALPAAHRVRRQGCYLTGHQ
jgi:hypothetical protein